jgi:hypothetical protein
VFNSIREKNILFIAPLVLPPSLLSPSPPFAIASLELGLQFRHQELIPVGAAQNESQYTVKEDTSTGAVPFF